MKPDLSLLAADGTADEKVVRTAYQGLRLAARLGRRAERALESLRRDGYLEGSFPVVRCGRLSDDGRVVRTTYFERKSVPARDQGPPLSDIALSFGRIGEGSHGGTEFGEVPVKIAGTFLVQKERTLNRYAGECRLGRLRLKKGQPSLELDGEGTVVPVYQEFRSGAAAIAAEAIGEFVASMAVTVSHGERETHFTAALREAACRWLVEEGHVARVCREMRRTARVMEVMPT